MWLSKGLILSKTEVNQSTGVGKSKFLIRFLLFLSSKQMSRTQLVAHLPLNCPAAEKLMPLHRRASKAFNDLQI